MKRTPFAIIIVLLVMFLLAAPWPRASQSPYATGRLAFYTTPYTGDSCKATLSFVSLQTQAVSSLVTACAYMSPAWSPDGNKLAVMKDEASTYPYHGIVIDVKSLQVAEVQNGDWANGTHVWGWTSDSRYAIFRSAHGSYPATVIEGNFVFDAQDWENVLASICSHSVGLKAQCERQSVAKSFTNEFSHWQAFVDRAIPANQCRAGSDPAPGKLKLECFQTAGLPGWKMSDVYLQDTRLSEVVTSFSWSPDEKLLAVGSQGALKIYDKNLNLLRSISVEGTVHSIAWSPVP